MTLFNVSFTPSCSYGISATTNLVAWYTIVHRGCILYIYNWPKITPCEKEVLEKQYIYLWICDDVRVNVTRQFCILNDTMLTCFFFAPYCILNRDVKHSYTFCAELANCGLNVLLRCETSESGQQAYVTAAHDFYWFLACWLHCLHWQICWRSAVFCRPV